MVLVTIILIFVIIYLFTKWNFSYWKRKGLEYIEPDIIFGNAKKLLTGKLSLGDFSQEIYNEFKSRGAKHGGIYIFQSPVYYPIDLDLIKAILQKDFSHFMNHGIYIDEELDPLTGNLFGLEDEKWRRMRAKLTPTFTSGKMKMMFSTMVACTAGFEDILRESARTQNVVEIKDVISRFTTDIIGSVAFGIDCNSLKNPDSEFRQFGKKVFDGSVNIFIKNFLARITPKYIIKFIKYKQTRQEIEDFFMGVVQSTVNYREKNNIYRKDFMHLLLQLKNRGKVVDDENIFGDKDVQKGEYFLTFNEVAAQCFVFFIAGFETSATTMTFALLELALNKDVQDNLRKEIDSVLEKYDEEVTYEAVMDMRYLDKIVHETLRKHPPFGALPRKCNTRYTVPNTDVVIEAGTRVQIPVQAIHKDPDYYPNPDKFDPERFSDENIAARHPFAFLPFGEGPRICIGSRFGMLQAKVGLISIIRNFQVTLNEKTKTPIEYVTRGFVTGVKGGVWLDITER